MMFKIGHLTLGWYPSEAGKMDDPDPGPKDATWHKVNVVEVKQIPGKGKAFITVRTSHGTLWECDLVVRSITDKRYKELKLLCELCGPYSVLCNHGALKMYITDCSINHAENDKELPLRVDPGDDDSALLNVATWTIKLLEAND